MSRSFRRALLVLLVLVLGACGGPTAPSPKIDAAVDASLDGGPARDSGTLDASVVDGEVRDANQPDAPDCFDSDGDGHADVACGGDDCDDADPSRYPRATEVCDSDDEDCDDTTFGADADSDGFQSALCCNGPGNCGPDCDDALNTVNPGASEVCNGGVDDDCDGLADAADGVCVPCGAGYRGFDHDCTNIDECAESAPCGGAAGAACADTDGSYACTCPSGYTGAATGGTCVDVDECASGSVCGAARASCINTPGSYVCGCNSGYTAPATGGTCVDVNECDTASTCGSWRAGCTNLPGSYACVCQLGYLAPATGGTCADLDECANAATCGGGRAGCTNTLGSYTCACAAGYTPPATGGTCVDNDECATIALCGHGTCTNTAGTYTCACDSGYAAPTSGGTCGDVDECLTTSTCGAQRNVCANNPGSYTCTCNAGYAAPASGGSCTDIDECTDPNTCGDGRSGCTNLVGTYACSCLSGYASAATGVKCADIDECRLGTDDCDRDPAALCTNTVPSFSCACPSAFTGAAHGTTGCLLIDPSLSGLGPSAGALSPAVAPTTMTYQLAVPLGTTSVTLSPTVLYPTRATIRVNGVVVASGASSASITVPTDFSVVPVSVSVTTETGAVLTYTVIVSRGSAFLKASNTNASDSFGGSVALSADGLTLAVGASYEASNAIGIGGSQTDNSALASGAVYVFTRAGPVWSQQAYIKASNTNAYDRFGVAVALSSDGSTLAVGAGGESSSATGFGGDQTNNSALASGAVYVFTRAGAVWSQQAYVKASNTGSNDSFGGRLALSSDGSTLAVGAASEDSFATGSNGVQVNEAMGQSGAVYVFVRAGTVWSQQAYVKASNTNAGDFFGAALALSSDGSTLAIGAPEESSSATGTTGNQAANDARRAGAVYVFTRAGTDWIQQAYVKASNTNANDLFGIAVALSGDGATLAVGAEEEASNATGAGGNQTDNSATSSGAVYVFTRTASLWSQQAYLKASNTDAGDGFGHAVALSTDGSRLAVNSYQEASNARAIGGDQGNNVSVAAGAAYMFMRAGTTWSQQAYVKASNTDASDYFGGAIALSGSGSTLVAGAEFEASAATGVGGDEADNSAALSGAAYVYWY